MRDLPPAVLAVRAIADRLATFYDVDRAKRVACARLQVLAATFRSDRRSAP